MNKTAIITMLRRLAKKHPTRKRFNSAVDKVFPNIGEGAFRKVYDADEYVIKLRHVWHDGMYYDKEEIDSGNWIEMDVYKQIARQAPSVAYFVLKPIYVKFSNTHDAIIMPKVETEMTVDEELLEYDKNGNSDMIEHFTPKMKLQYKFIDKAFKDGGDSNMGWDMKKERVWYLDLNYEADDANDLFCCRAVAKRRAKALRKKLIA